jgi:uncharacterized protein
MFEKVNELFINFTRDCNLKCNYCFEKYKYKQNISYEVIYELIKFIDENKEMKYFELFGGEPYLALDEINYFVDGLIKIFEKTKREFHIAVITNGTIYNEQIKELVKKIKKNFNFYYIVSLDGDKVTHDKNRKSKNGIGSYDLALKNSKLFKNDFPDVRMEYHCVVNKDVANNFYKCAKTLFRNNLFVSGTFKFLTNTNCDNGYTIKDYENVYKDIMRLNEEGYSLEFLTERLDGLLYGIDYRYRNSITEKDICFNCDQILNIDVDGEIYPCNHYVTVEMDQLKQFSIYNLITKKSREFPKDKICNRCYIPECDSCVYKYSCYICSASVEINKNKGFEYCCNENKKIHKAMENVNFIIK